MARIVLVMHEPLASAFASCAQHVLGAMPDIDVVDIKPDEIVETKTQQLVEQFISYDEGVLVLCDLVGATPFNIAKSAIEQAQQQGCAASMLTGANLNMVIKAIADQTKNPYTLRDEVCARAMHGIIMACKNAEDSSTNN